MLIDINEDFRKMCSIEGDKLKDFGGELVKGRGGEVGGACFTAGDELKDVLGANWKWGEISSYRLTTF